MKITLIILVIVFCVSAYFYYEIKKAVPEDDDVNTYLEN